MLRECRYRSLAAKIAPDQTLKNHPRLACIWNYIAKACLIASAETNRGMKDSTNANRQLAETASKKQIFRVQEASFDCATGEIVA